MQGKYERAERLFKRALYIREQNLGPHHLQTLKTRSTLLQLLELMGRVEETALRKDQMPAPESILLCACGCGSEIDTSKSRGEPRRFFSNACKQRFYRNIARRKRNATSA